SRITGENFLLVPVTIGVKGGWNEVLAFTHGVQTSSRLMLVTTVNTSEDQGIFTTTLSGTMYVLVRPPAPASMTADDDASASDSATDGWRDRRRPRPSRRGRRLRHHDYDQSPHGGGRRRRAAARPARRRPRGAQRRGSLGTVAAHRARCRDPALRRGSWVAPALVDARGRGRPAAL